MSRDVTSTSIRARGAHKAVALLAWSLAAVSLAVVRTAWEISLVRCDERCGEPPVGGWRSTIDAWQWNGQLALAGCAAGLALVAVICLTLARYRAGGVTLALSAAALVTWTLLAGVAS